MLDQFESGNLFAVVPAAGSSTRMKGQSPHGSKIFLELNDGRTVLEHSLESLRLAGVRSCVIPSSKNLIQDVGNLIRGLSGWDNIEVIEGGKTRFDSVLAGISYLKNNFTISNVCLLVIHDAARPFCTSDLVKTAINLASKGEGVVLAVPVINTIKQCTVDGKVINTLDRDTLFEIQTPQVFNFQKISEAYFSAINISNKIKLFDDASVYELAGFPVRILQGSRQNVKITYGDELNGIGL